MASAVDEVDEEYLQSAEYLNKTSEKARYYQTLFREAMATFDAGDRASCREQCLTLLAFPDLPNYTRIETLHLVAPCTDIFISAKGFLEKAMTLINEIQVKKKGKPSKHLDAFREGNKTLLDRATERDQWFKENPDYVDHSGDDLYEFAEDASSSESKSLSEIEGGDSEEKDVIVEGQNSQEDDSHERSAPAVSSS